ncbi:MAG: phytanoyl-CoA dioxygenase family protein [Candidatus Dormibacteraeota bacterium]|uniref:Phytanoyl-CoA dioxygenase family protein n=1 Tax=Candidatus Amunia macphersoniae TaxID=3127014 RepID=A0A934NAS1_9BACT|nr:phytanoyl-CoA dioxygenase family protein [Candidatus Dormibacteraeota bacterium]
MAAITTRGYVLIREAVGRDALEALRTAIDAAVAAGGDGVDVRAGTVWIRDAGVLGEPVEALRTSPPVLEAVCELLGRNPAPISAVMRNPVGRTAQQALHVDWAGPIAPGRDQQAQAMFYLDDVSAENGPTRVVPGSHRSASIPPKNLSDPRARHRDEVCITCPAGDALVFSSHLWHSGTANTSGRPRRVITVTYRRDGSGRV